MLLARPRNHVIKPPGFHVSFKLLAQSASRCSRSSSANFQASCGGNLRIASRISVTVLIARESTSNFEMKPEVRDSCPPSRWLPTGRTVVLAREHGPGDQVSDWSVERAGEGSSGGGAVRAQDRTSGRGIGQIAGPRVGRCRRRSRPADRRS